jgi:hypothetical protein
MVLFRPELAVLQRMEYRIFRVQSDASGTRAKTVEPE